MKYLPLLVLAVAVWWVFFREKKPADGTVEVTLGDVTVLSRTP